MAGKFPRQKMNRPPMDAEDMREPPETPGEIPDAEDIAEGPEPKAPYNFKHKPKPKAKAKPKMMQPPDFADGPPPRATNMAMLHRAMAKGK